MQATIRIMTASNESVLTFSMSLGEEVMEREKQLCANVDLYAAPVFWMLGFPPELNTPLFAASRVAGWCAHVIEQQDNNRLIRPRSLYVGPELRPYPGSPK